MPGHDRVELSGIMQGGTTIARASLELWSGIRHDLSTQAKQRKPSRLMGLPQYVGVQTSEANSVPLDLTVR